MGSMIRNHKAASALAGAILAALLVTASWRAGAASAGGSQPPKQQLVHFTLFEVPGSTELIDLGEEGFSVGDWFVESSSVVDPSSGDVVGSLKRHLQVVEVLPGDDFGFIVHATLLIDEGKIQWDGAVRYSEVVAGTAVAPVTGGTGAFAHTSGTAGGALGQLDGKDGLFLTFDITKSAR